MVDKTLEAAPVSANRSIGRTAYLHLCVSINPTTLEQLKIDFDEAVAAGADLVELRLDGLDPSELERISEIEPWLTSHAERLILTCRPEEQGGHYDGSISDRTDVLAWAGAQGPRFVDVEHASYRSSKTLRQRIELWAHASGSGRIAHLIHSAHHLEARPVALQKRFDELCAGPAEAIKLVWRAEDSRGDFEALDLLRSQKDKPASVFCADRDGLPSRILGRRFGNHITYCALRKGDETSPGQPTADELVNVYRWKKISSDTAVYGLVGDPVAHSLSPCVHNAAFDRYGINAVYVPFRVAEGALAFAEFMSEIAKRPWLDVRGLSVTTPHKEAACMLVESELDPVSKRIGSVNTLTFHGEHVSGANTDYQAAIDWIKRHLECDLGDLAGRRIDILGAGGFARSLVAALCLVRAEVCVYNRTLQRAQHLANQFACQAAELDDDTTLLAGVLVNCTSVGMWPEVEHSPIRCEQINDGSIVFDAIYNPRKTRLLADAEARGCRIVDGLELFVDQAAMQFKLWSEDKKIDPRPVMRQAALERMQAGVP